LLDAPLVNSGLQESEAVETEMPPDMPSGISPEEDKEKQKHEELPPDTSPDMPPDVSPDMPQDEVPDIPLKSSQMLASGAPDEVPPDIAPEIPEVSAEDNTAKNTSCRNKNTEEKHLPVFNDVSVPAGAPLIQKQK